jgi:hypothetical protein
MRVQRPRSIAPALVIWLVNVIGALPAHAQTRPVLGAIDGFVTDTSLAPLSDATAWILGSKLEVATGENGRFRIVGLPAGGYLLMVRRMGYVAASTAVQVSEGDTTRLWLPLTRAATALDTVRVSAKNESGRLAEFEMRRKYGDGLFMTQVEIEKLNLVSASDLLRHFMAVGTAGGAALNRRTLPAKSCPFQFFIDGVKVPTPRLDTNLPSPDLPSPKELAGIEVYANSASVPLQYKTINGGGFCGVILLWTRIGG